MQASETQHEAKVLELEAKLASLKSKSAGASQAEQHRRREIEIELASLRETEARHFPAQCPPFPPF